jgi:uncharacterized membrane protein YccF (DUF307 family)
MLANYTLWPFGRDVIARDELYGREDIGTGGLGMVGNIVWFILAGWWLAVMHLTFAVANAVTIIGIPFAWAHVKLAGASLFPVGKTVQDIEVVDEALAQLCPRPGGADAPVPVTAADCPKAKPRPS